ncbi:MAG: hypothetical protein CVU11_00145 [Bacteroidetes bacterium HGW-Bacteroidetes-6]|jgi:hypothetical protein|nr:MAG: hypothetical protein CVU11_00145 [Bacteroidetes bacterium HGW-Bacteroidetes-6]
MSKIRKKTVRILLIAYVVIFCIPAALFALLRTPFVQLFIANQLASYFSSELHTKVEIGSVDIRFPLDITLSDVYVEDLHRNPLISAHEITIAPDNLDFSFSSLDFEKVLVSEANFRLMKYEGEEKPNIDFIISYFTAPPKEKTTQTKSSPSMHVNVFELRNCSFMYQDQNRDTADASNINFNNIFLTNLNLLAENMVQTDSLTCANLKHVAFSDRSGFSLFHLSSQVSMTNKKIDAKNLQLLANNSSLDLDLSFNYDSIPDFNDFLNKVSLDANFRKSKVGFADIARFVPALKGMNSTIVLTGHANGTIANLSATNMKVESGKRTHLFFNLSMKGLPDFNNTDIHFDLINGNVQIADLELFTLPGGEKLNLGSSLGSLNTASLTANFDGTIEDFSANVVAKTNSGFAKADVISHGAFPNPVYSGNVIVENFDLQPFAGTDIPLGSITASVKFTGNGASKTNYFVEGKADIASIGYKNYNYSSIQINGKTKPGSFEGRLLINDPNAALDFNGMIDFSDSLPVFDFIAQIENINLNPLHFNRNDSISGLSGIIDISIKGNKPDNMLGRISLNNFEYFEGEHDIYLSSLQLKLDKTDSVNKKIDLKSDLVNGSIEGQFTFSEIDKALQSYLSNYIPSFYAADSTVKELARQSFTFNFNIKDVQPALDIFAPGLVVSPNSIARGNFNLADNYLKTEIASNFIKSGNITSVNPVLIAETFNNNIYLTAQCDRLVYNDSLELGNVVANTVTFNDNSSFSLYWKNENSSKAYSGDLSGDVLFRRGMPLMVTFNESDLVLNDSLYHIAPSGKVEVDTDYIRISEFAIFSNAQKLVIDGRISKDPYDLVQISFDNVLLDDFDDLTRSASIDLDGTVDGYILLSNLYDVPDYRADIQIGKLSLNKNFVGDAHIKSSWDQNRQAVYSEAAIIYTGNVGSNVPLDIKGFFNPRDPINMFDLTVTLDRFNLKLIQPYLKSFSSRIDGSCDGKIAVKGNIDNPDVRGTVTFRRTNILVDYLNMYYSFANTLQINNSEISMRNTTFFDSHGNPATGDLVVTHNHFKDFYFDISLMPEKMQFLNTTARDNDYFYGTAYASGLVKIFGPPDNISIEVAATTDPGSILYIPITSAGEVYENDFISFVSSPSDTGKTVSDIKVGDTGINLVFDLDVTSDAEVQIVFDPKIGDVMKGSGQGRIRMTIDRSGEFLMFGNLEIEKGDYLFTLENVINKHFLVDPGGIIRWNGDPYEGEMDLVARYNIKTSLYELVSVADPSEIYKKKVPVSCLMHLTGNLLSPDIGFDLDLPGSDENTKNLVHTIIGNAEEMNRQVFALLILNSFIPAERSSFNSPISQGVGATSSELITSQFSNWLSQISKDFDIGFSYSQGNEVSTSQVEVALSTQIFNDRIELESNVAVGGNQVGTPENQQASSIVGDVSIEYKITPDGKFRVKAFNRSNTVDIVTNNAPYTQGVAFFYRRDFDRFGELWRRKNKKKTTE